MQQVHFSRNYRDLANEMNECNNMRLLMSLEYKDVHLSEVQLIDKQLFLNKICLYFKHANCVQLCWLLVLTFFFFLRMLMSAFSKRNI